MDPMLGAPPVQKRLSLVAAERQDVRAPRASDRDRAVAPRRGRVLLHGLPARHVLRAAAGAGVGDGAHAARGGGLPLPALMALGVLGHVPAAGVVEVVHNGGARGQRAARRKHVAVLAALHRNHVVALRAPVGHRHLASVLQTSCLALLLGACGAQAEGAAVQRDVGMLWARPRHELPAVLGVRHQRRGVARLDARMRARQCVRARLSAEGGPAIRVGKLRGCCDSLGRGSGVPRAADWKPRTMAFASRLLAVAAFKAGRTVELRHEREPVSRARVTRTVGGDSGGRAHDVETQASSGGRNNEAVEESDKAIAGAGANQ
mmetsp:Transcript_33335/g.76160  ORF Transcript_33335/g.76160 Transcript_33335/m.76160 type:complete len:319 (+) Transcript_33335:427-1383(+)